MSYWFSCDHPRLEMRRRTAETTRTALIRWWKTWRTCCQTSLSSHLPPKRKSRPHLVCSHFPIFSIVHYKPVSTRLPSALFLYSAISDVVIEKGSKSPKMKPGAAAKGVSLQKDVSLAAPNPRAPVTRAPGPRRGPPGNARGPSPGPGRGRGRGGPPRK